MNGRQNEPIARQTATAMLVAGASGMVHSTLIKTRGTAARKRSQIDKLEVREGKEWKRIEEGKKIQRIQLQKKYRNRDPLHGRTPPVAIVHPDE